MRHELRRQISKMDSLLPMSWMMKSLKILYIYTSHGVVNFGLGITLASVDWFNFNHFKHKQPHHRESSTRGESVRTWASILVGFTQLTLKTRMSFCRKLDPTIQKRELGGSLANVAGLSLECLKFGEVTWKFNFPHSLDILESQRMMAEHSSMFPGFSTQNGNRTPFLVCMMNYKTKTALTGEG